MQIRARAPVGPSHHSFCRESTLLIAQSSFVSEQRPGHGRDSTWYIGNSGATGICHLREDEMPNAAAIAKKPGCELDPGELAYQRSERPG